MQTNFVEAVLNPARLEALRRLGLLDTPAEAAFDRLGDLAAKVLNTPVALVTLVDDEGQFFKSCRGLPEPWATWRKTPLSHSFCKHVVSTSEPLVVNDARVHPLFRENLAIQDLGVVAYLGIPLKLDSGEVLGSFCVIDSQPRIWTNDEIQILRVLTCSVMTEVELRSEMHHRKQMTRQVEELNARLEAKMRELELAHSELEAFSYSASHDVRAPLVRVQNFCSFLREECNWQATDSCSSYLDAIERSVNASIEVLEGVCFLAGLSKRPIARQNIDLSAMAREIAAQLQKREPERTVEFRIADQLEVQADPALMRIVLDNLIGNAWKFTSKQRHAQIEIGRINEGERTFFIRDNGAGFDMKNANKLFATFERLHRSDEFEGSGIGLATVQKIINRHGGRVWAEAKVNEGATFYFAIPDLNRSQGI